MGMHGNPVNFQQLQTNSGEGVIAHNQMWIIIITTRQAPYQEAKAKSTAVVGSYLRC